MPVDLPPEQFDDGLTHQHARQRANAAQEQAFHDGLLKQTHAAGAQCAAHGVLAHTRDGAGQHEAGDVEAGQRPDAEDDNVKQQQRLTRFAVQRLLVTAHFYARGPIEIRGKSFGDNRLRRD